MNRYGRVTQIALDVHKNFSKLTGRDTQGKIICARDWSTGIEPMAANMIAIAATLRWGANYVS